ncbi:hypothetical protein LMG26857_03568 [Achromobacter anxifer]|uniref:hypothetical protein n=1 Tax=Achromobacter anxifer TaxID=1287737 RepID=UPI00155D1247|nr:hypothetical protein [Achromobacter anxifer]CAB5514509.1 hypothetical protein LMG26857_03568 [Achromobacter anxifer]
MTAVSLGERLKSINAQTEAERVAKATRDAAERDAKAAADLLKVQSFFEQGKSQIISAIEHGKAPKGVKMPSDVGSLVQSYRWNDNNGMAKPSHPYHFVWSEFQGWAQENGLTPDLVYGHDGCGRESWHTLVVKPM